MENEKELPIIAENEPTTDAFNVEKFRGFTIEELERITRILDIKERILNKEAEQKFNTAIANFQNKCPKILKKKEVSFKSSKNPTSRAVSYSYTPLDHLVEDIKTSLNQEGLSFSFLTKNLEDNLMEVTCTISHINGHARKHSSVFPMTLEDSSLGLNSLQKVKAAMTYAKRAVLENALGIAPSDEDVDGNLHLVDLITDEQKNKIKELIEKTKTDEVKFLKLFDVEHLEEIKEKDFKKAAALLMQKSKMIEVKEKEGVKNEIK